MNSPLIKVMSDGKNPHYRFEWESFFNIFNTLDPDLEDKNKDKKPEKKDKDDEEEDEDEINQKL